MVRKHSVLNIGLDVNHPLVAGVIPNHAPAEEIVKMVESTRAKMHEMGYTDYKAIMLNPDKLNEELTLLLKERKWDALVIGGAFKLVPALNTHLEEVIYLTREVSPSTQILFTMGPAGVLDAIKRIKA